MATRAEVDELATFLVNQLTPYVKWPQIAAATKDKWRARAQEIVDAGWTKAGG